MWLPAAINIAPPRPGTVEPQPLASLLDNVDDVTVICAPRGEFTSADVDAGMTKIAPPVGAVFLRTIVEPSIASFVGAFSVFGTSAKAPPPTAYKERQLEPLTAELDSISDASLIRTSHAPARYIAPPRPEATLDLTLTPEPTISPPP